MNTRLLKSFIFTFFGILVLTSSCFAETNLEFFFNTRPDSKYADVIIERVVSADTLILDSGEKIKLIGVTVPEPPREKKEKEERDKYGMLIRKEVFSIETLASRTLDDVRELLEGKHVRLEFDTQQKDDANDTLAYAFFLEDDTFINAEILRQGYAQLQIKFPNKKYVKELRAAYQESRKEKRGLQGE